MAEAKDQVLIIEDDMDWAVVYLEMLKPIGCRIQIATTLREAEEKLNAESFQFAILDVNLGEGRDGEQLLPKLAELDIPVIIITGYSILRVARSYYKQYGVVDVIEKAYLDLHELRSIVLQCLREDTRA